MSTIQIDSEIDLTQLTDRLRKAIETAYPPGPDKWINIQQCTPEYIVYACSGDYFKVSYTLAPETQEPQLGQPVAVKMTFTAESYGRMAKQDSKGWKWHIDLVQEGLTLSANIPLAPMGLPGKFAYKDYTVESIRNAIANKVFENRPFLVRSESSHFDSLPGARRIELKTNDEARQMGAVISSVVESVTPDGRIKAVGVLEIANVASGRALRRTLLAAEKDGGQLGASWTGEIRHTMENVESATPTMKVLEIVEVVSVDPCEVGNAGGKITSIAEAAKLKSVERNTMLKDKNPKGYNAAKSKMIAFCVEAAVEGADEASVGGATPATLVEFVAKYLWDNDVAMVQTHYKTQGDLEAAGEEVLVELFAKHLETNEPEEEVEEQEEMITPVAESAVLKSMQAELDKLRAQNTAQYLETRLNSDDMKFVPEVLKSGMRKVMQGQTVESAKIDEMLRDLKKDAGNMYQDITAMPKGVVTDQRSKYDKGFMHLMFKGLTGAQGDAIAKNAEAILGYNPKSKDADMGWYSLKRAWMDMLGVSELGSTLWGNAEAASAEITALIATNALNVRLISEYNIPNQFDDWMKIADVVSANDFRAIQPQKIGQFAVGLGVPSTDSSPYDVLTLEGDEEVSYSVSRRGNLFDITVVDVINDRISYVQKIPSRLVRMAKRDLYESLFDIVFAANTTAYNPEGGSGQMLCSNDALRKNISTSPGAISKAEIIEGRTAMRRQTELGSGKPAGLTPKYLIHMTKDLEAAHSVTIPGYGLNNGVATADQTLGLERIEVDYWDDTLRKWFLVGDKSVQAPFEVAFLNGRTEPNIVPEAIGTGSNFTSEVVRNRITFPWGLSPVDHRPLWMVIAS